MFINRFKTKTGSIYELDTIVKCYRKIGDDMWRPFTGFTPIQVGLRVYITNEFNKTYIHTSSVVEIVR